MMRTLLLLSLLAVAFASPDAIIDEVVPEAPQTSVVQETAPQANVEQHETVPDKTMATVEDSHLSLTAADAMDPSLIEQGSQMKHSLDVKKLWKKMKKTAKWKNLKKDAKDYIEEGRKQINKAKKAAKKYLTKMKKAANVAIKGKNIAEEMAKDILGLSGVIPHQPAPKPAPTPSSSSRSRSTSGAKDQPHCASQCANWKRRGLCGTLPQVKQCCAATCAGEMELLGSELVQELADAAEESTRECKTFKVPNIDAIDFSLKKILEERKLFTTATKDIKICRPSWRKKAMNFFKAARKGTKKKKKWLLKYGMKILEYFDGKKFSKNKSGKWKKWMNADFSAQFDNNGGMPYLKGPSCIKEKSYGVQFTISGEVGYSKGYGGAAALEAGFQVGCMEFTGGTKTRYWAVVPMWGWGGAFSLGSSSGGSLNANVYVYEPWTYWVHDSDEMSVGIAGSVSNTKGWGLNGGSADLIYAIPESGIMSRTSPVKVNTKSFMIPGTNNVCKPAGYVCDGADKVCKIGCVGIKKCKTKCYNDLVKPCKDKLVNECKKMFTIPYFPKKKLVTVQEPTGVHIGAQIWGSEEENVVLIQPSTGRKIPAAKNADGNWELVQEQDTEQEETEEEVEKIDITLNLGYARACRHWKIKKIAKHCLDGVVGSITRL